MKRLDIQITTDDPRLESDMLERREYSSNEWYRIGVGEVSLNPRPRLKSVDSPEIIDVTIKILAGVSSSVVAKWLLEKLRGKTIRRLRMNHKEVRFEKGEIMRVIEETLEVGE